MVTFSEWHIEMGSGGARIDLVHGILWSKYKASVFSEMHRLARDYDFALDFYQVAETDLDRLSLSSVDFSCHEYPFTLLFKGPYSEIPRAALARRLFGIIYRSDAQLVLLPGFSEASHWAMLFAALLSGKKRMVFCDSTLRDRGQSSLKGFAKRVFFRLCNGYLTYGARGREYLERYGACSDRIYQRVQAAALPANYSPQKARDLRVEKAPGSREPVFLYVGRLSPEKSLDVLLRAFQSVARRLPAARLRIVGGGVLLEKLTALSISLGVADRVLFVGGVGIDELAEEYAGATCLVLPSRSEPWGLVVNEAFHYGCPAVVSDNCGCVPELLENQQTGFVFKTDSVSDLAEKLIMLAEHDDMTQMWDRCLSVIASYVPLRAAQQTFDGCARVLADARS